MNTINALTNTFSKLPGIGPRQARRLVDFLVRSNPNILDEISENVLAIKHTVVQCLSCHRHFPKEDRDVNNASMCLECRDESRDKTRMLVLSGDIDLERFAKSGIYDGRYYIFGGTLPLLQKIAKKTIKIEEFSDEVERRAKEEGLKEVIFAFSVNPEGENTADILSKEIDSISNQFKLTVSVLGRGLSTGTEIEYSDNETLKNALQNRS